MRPVAIAGIGLTKVSEHWEKGLKDLFKEAAIKAIQDAGIGSIEALYVANMGAPILQKQIHLGAMLANALGFQGIPALSIGAASASGGVAFHEGVKSVASGYADCVLVGGVEKMSDGLPEEVLSTFSLAEDQEYTSYTGITHIGLNALIHRKYMENFGVTAEEIAMFAVRDHENAVGSKHSQYPFKVAIDRVLASPMEADPIHMLETSAVGDGAAAVVLMPAEKAPEGIEVAATSMATGPYYLAGRKDITTFDAVVRAGANAYKDAGISPKEVDLVEVHDVTTISGVVSLEDLGFVEKGKGAAFVADGSTLRGGELPTNTFGGLKARGNPLGATGLYQIGEIALQLQGRADACQVNGAKVGLAESMGGLGSTCAVTILRRM